MKMNMSYYDQELERLRLKRVDIFLENISNETKIKLWKIVDARGC